MRASLNNACLWRITTHTHTHTRPVRYCVLISHSRATHSWLMLIIIFYGVPHIYSSIVPPQLPIQEHDSNTCGIWFTFLDSRACYKRRYIHITRCCNAASTRSCGQPLGNFPSVLKNTMLPFRSIKVACATSSWHACSSKSASDAVSWNHASGPWRIALLWLFYTISVYICVLLEVTLVERRRK